MSVIFKHADLGDLKGKVVDGTVQFLGLKYASLKDRLAPPELVTSYGSSLTDASNYGPPPISPIGAIQTEFAFIQHTLPTPEVPAQSDLEGLNLNITLPLGKSGDIDSSSKLPVYVYIHGGGFAVGSNWYPHYSATPMVKLSVEKGNPLIGISINYRLGVPGFLTSDELRKAGYKANNGFHDQRTALKWIKKFIGGFGGDGDEITVAGESAGGLSATMLLLSKEPLMKRCLSTGGPLFFLRPMPAAVAEASYQRVIEAFGLADKSPEDRITSLLTLPVDELWQKVPINVPVLPSIDGDLILGEPNFANIASQEDDATFAIPGRKWCAALMIGDSQLDANILAWMGLDIRNPDISTKFVDSIQKTLSSHPEVASTLLSFYNITPSTTDDEALLSIVKFASDIAFYATNLALAKSWPQTKHTKTFLYHFNEGNPWDGRYKGEAGHILDIAFLFQNFNQFLDDGQKAVAHAYAEDFINFVNGEDPWPPVRGADMGARVYGPSSSGITTKYVASGNPEDVGRRGDVFRLGEMVGLDVILGTFERFFQGK